MSGGGGEREGGGGGNQFGTLERSRGRGGKLYYWNIRATLHLILVCSAITVPHV